MADVFSITTINGKRCTAVPRAVNTEPSSSKSTSTSVTSSKTSTTPAQPTRPTNPPAPAPVPPAPSAPQPQSTTESTSSTAPAAPPAPTTSTMSTTSTSNIPPPATTSEPPAPSVPPAAPSSSIPTTAPASSTSTQVAIPNDASTTTSISSATSSSMSVTSVPASSAAAGASTPLAALQPTARPTSLPASTTALALDATSTNGNRHAGEPLDSIASTSHTDPASVIGGVIGGVAFIAIFAFLIWFLLRRRRRRNLFLTPLDRQPDTTTKESYFEIDDQSLGPTRRTTKLKASAAYYFGYFVGSVSSALRRNKSHPGVNLDRGQSQFFEKRPLDSRGGPSPPPYSDENARLGSRLAFWRRRSNDSSQDAYIAARVLASAAAANAPRSPVHRRSISLPPPVHTSISPFADPPGTPQHYQSSTPFLHIANPSAPFTDPFNPRPPSLRDPFMDPPSRRSSQIRDLRRSRGQTIPALSRPASAQSSQWGGNRDTVFTRTPGRRSDPFDLERLGGLNLPPPVPELPELPRGSGMSEVSREITFLMGGGNNNASPVDSWTSHYSSQWGDPGTNAGIGEGASAKSPAGSGKTVGKAL